jgi:hypothetical protein
MVLHAWNLSILEVETRGLLVQGLAKLHREILLQKQNHMKHIELDVKLSLLIYFQD